MVTSEALTSNPSVLCPLSPESPAELSTVALFMTVVPLVPVAFHQHKRYKVKAVILTDRNGLSGRVQDVKLVERAVALDSAVTAIRMELMLERTALSLLDEGMLLRRNQSVPGQYTALTDNSQACRHHHWYPRHPNKLTVEFNTGRVPGSS